MLRKPLRKALGQNSDNHRRTALVCTIREEVPATSFADADLLFFGSPSPIRTFGDRAIVAHNLPESGA